MVHRKSGSVTLPDLLPKDGIMAATLVIGYGNPSREDDGVGLAVVNGLRARLDLPPLDEEVDGFGELGRPLDTLFLQQLTPELSETLAEYGHVVFVDAHLGIYQDLVHHETITPAAETTMVTHHMKPSALLGLTAQFFHATPTCELISIRGFSFDFSDTLSPQTAEGVAQVIGELWERFGSANPQ
jgi:hydrogenase maturation protease